MRGAKAEGVEVTSNRDVKRLIRQHQAETGAKYTEARRAVLAHLEQLQTAASAPPPQAEPAPQAPPGQEGGAAKPSHVAPRDGDPVDAHMRVVRILATGNADWAVVLAADENGELVRMVGTMLARIAAPGELLRVIGRWRNDDRYGMQIRVRSAVVVAVTAVSRPALRPSEIFDLLGDVPKVGNQRRKQLLDRFGELVIEKIDENPLHAFEKVAGMGFQEARDAARWWIRRRGLEKRQSS